MSGEQGATGAGPARPSLSLVGVGLMLAAIACNTLEVTFVHALGPGWPAPLQLFWRQGVGLLLIAPFVLRDPRGILTVSRPGILLFRSMAAMSALLLTIYAFSHLPMATANALTFTRPLWIVLLAALFLGERVGVWRGGAVLFGFAGVLVMLNPGAAHDNWLAEGAILLASLLFAASFVSIKSMTGDNRTTTIVVYGMMFGLVLSAIPAFMQWRTPSLQQGLLLASLGFTSLGGFAFFAKALHMADAIVLGSLDYLRLPLIIAIGIWLFGESPTGALLLGSMMIVASTVTVTVRERMGKQTG